MDSEKYIATQQQVGLLAAFALRMPLAEFLHAISVCDTVAPLVDPTLYLKGSAAMNRVERLARAAKKYQDEVREIYERDDTLRPLLEEIDQRDASPGDDERRCRICGCTEGQACETEAGTCTWVEWDLCSNPACLEAAGYEDVELQKRG